MPFHFCSDELLLLMSILPFVGIYFKRLHAWYHNHKNHKAHGVDKPHDIDKPHQ